MTIDDIPKDNESLTQLFLTAACPDTEEFDGVYKVKMLTGFPLWWNYKHIAQRSGTNKLLLKQWGHFHLKYGTVHGLNLAVLLDYDQPENSVFTRRIRDYVRRLDTGLYLGAFNYAWQGECRFVGYFLLIEAETAGEYVYTEA